MKTSTKDHQQVSNHEFNGSGKEISGIVSDNPKLEAEGSSEKVIGNFLPKNGQINRVAFKTRQLLIDAMSES